MASIEFNNRLTTAQSDRYITFGQAFFPGDVPSTATLGLKMNGSFIPVQVDKKAANPDGSLRHAVITANIANLGTSPLQGNLVAVTPGAAQTPIASSAVTGNSNYDVVVSLNMAGQVYTASAKTALTAAISAGKVENWLQGPLVSEFNVSQSLTPFLRAQFDIRAYANGEIWTDVGIYNSYGFKVGITDFTYDVNIKNASGSVLYSKPALKHVRFTSWHKVFWFGGKDPQIFVKQDRFYLQRTAAIPNYKASVVPDPATLNKVQQMALDADCGPMGAGTIMPYMSSAGGRFDIGILPGWDSIFFTSQDPRAEALLLCNNDAAASIPWHITEESTLQPFKLTDHPNAWIDSRGCSSGDPLGDRVTSGGSCSQWNTAASIFMPETAHTPSLGYSAYLITGNRRYLYEMLYEAAAEVGMEWNAPREGAKGLIAYDQTRGQAWTMRSLANAAYITPDTHPLKAYFNQLVDRNLQNYIDRFVNGPDGRLQGEMYGFLPGGQSWATDAKGVWRPMTIAPWQNDYAVVVFGYLAHRGYTKAETLLRWMGNYTVGRFMQRCRTVGIDYWTDLTNGNNLPASDPLTWEAVYQRNYGGVCPTTLGGYPDSTEDFAIISYGALGIMVNMGIPNAQNAWNYIYTTAPVFFPTTRPTGTQIMNTEPTFAIDPY